MNRENLKNWLDNLVEQYNQPTFIENDPILIPHSYSKLQDIEISGFFAATLAWGQRKSIIKNCKILMGIMDETPHDFILEFGKFDFLRIKKFVHRTFNGEDLLFFMQFLRNHYKANSSLESAFSQNTDKKQNQNTYHHIENFRSKMLREIHQRRSEKHIGNPSNGAACKRLHLFLKWMVRKDTKGVDFGLWKTLHPSQLIIPLDVHVHRAAIELELLKRKQTDRKSAELLTFELRKLDKSDPVKYDYALFGIGKESGKSLVTDKLKMA